MIVIKNVPTRKTVIDGNFTFIGQQAEYFYLRVYGETRPDTITTYLRLYTPLEKVPICHRRITVIILQSFTLIPPGTEAW